MLKGTSETMYLPGDDPLVQSLQALLSNSTPEHPLDSQQRLDLGILWSRILANRLPSNHIPSGSSGLDDIEENGSECSSDMQPNCEMTSLPDDTRMFSPHSTFDNLQKHESNTKFANVAYDYPIQSKGKSKEVESSEYPWRFEQSFMGVSDEETETLRGYDSDDYEDEEIGLDDALDGGYITEDTRYQEVIDSKLTRASFFGAFFGHSGLGLRDFQSSAEFIAGPSRITLDDLRRNRALGGWQW